MTSQKLRILFSGMIAGVPCHGGATWAVLQYLIGLRRLGHTVYFVEPIDESALSPHGSSFASSLNANYFQRVMSDFGFTEYSALLARDSKQTVGLSFSSLRTIAKDIDLLINVSGMLTEEAIIPSIPVRAYLDLDPAFIQLWAAVDGIDMHFAGHTHFVTVGQAIGTSSCSIPTCGLTWIPTFQPVVLDHWPVEHRNSCGALTTVGNWRGYGSVTHNGVLYGQKVHSFREFFTFPAKTDERFTLALAIHPGEVKDLEALVANGWEIVDPAAVANTPARYQEFIRTSKAEFSVAKSGYVASRSAWFSDRSACYLASGRPVIAQETGYSDFMQTGRGLFPFSTEEDVLHSIDQLNSDYALHARSARELAHTYFHSDTVLSQLIDRLYSPRSSENPAEPGESQTASTATV
jgi:hypothetical protein